MPGCANKCPSRHEQVGGSAKDCNKRRQETKAKCDEIKRRNESKRPASGAPTKQPEKKTDDDKIASTPRPDRPNEADKGLDEGSKQISPESGGGTTKQVQTEQSRPSNFGLQLSSAECEKLCQFFEQVELRREEDQAIIDKYYLYRGSNYFDDLCCCSLRCMFKQLWSDTFVVNIGSTALFLIIGVKLCFELDNWTIK